MLSNVYSNWGELKKALEYARKFHSLAVEMEDTVATAAAKMMINDLGKLWESVWISRGYFALQKLCIS